MHYRLLETLNSKLPCVFLLICDLLLTPHVSLSSHSSPVSDVILVLPDGLSEVLPDVTAPAVPALVAVWRSRGTANAARTSLRISLSLFVPKGRFTTHRGEQVNIDTRVKIKHALQPIGNSKFPYVWMRE